MDKLLGAFVKSCINELSDNDLINLEKLLDVDDANLYNFISGLETDVFIEKNNVTELFKNFKYLEN